MDLKNNSVIGKNTLLGNDYIIEPFTIIGYQPSRSKSPKKTIVGINARIRSHTVIYSGNKIGDHFTTGHGVLIREENEIGNNVSIGSHTVIEHHVKIGNNVRIHSGSFIPEFTVIEDDAWIGPNVTLTNAKYPASHLAKQHLKGPHIMHHARIGGGCTILPGVIVGPDVLVGAGSVVTRDVKKGNVVAGNPAEILNDIKTLKYKTGEKAY